MVIELLKKLRESFLSSIPVIAVVLLIYFLKLIDITVVELVLFLISALLIILGMWLFNAGAEKSMSKIGEYLGSSLTRKQSILYLILIFFLVGIFVTVAEPDLAVMAEQVPINKWVLILSIAVGVGLFLVVAAVRILFKKSLKVWLLAFYGLLFALACLMDYQYIPLSLDSGGVTTGPITVPFILALGVGLSATRSGNKSADSFGFVAFSSIGPILVVMILMLASRQPLSYDYLPNKSANEWAQMGERFAEALLPMNGNYGALLSVLISLTPILLFFIVYDLLVLKLNAHKMLEIVRGLIMTFFGLVFFLTAVEAGFMPIGEKLGINIAQDGMYWVLIVVGIFLGVSAVLAEPAVHVLTGQIEDVSNGAVNKITVLIALAVGNGLAIGLSMLRIIEGFSLLYIIVPGYIIAFALSFFVPGIYFSIAFDSGGVVSGPMNTTFILPYAIGACWVINGYTSDKIMTDAFGMVATVALMPLLTIQLIGLVATFRKAYQYKIARSRIREEFDDQIIHF